MTQEQAEFLQKAIDWDCNEARIRDDYSGRSMYGGITHGVVTDLDAVDALVCALNYAKNVVDDMNDIPDFEGLRQDSLGHEVILY